MQESGSHRWIDEFDVEIYAGMSSKVDEKMTKKRQILMSFGEEIVDFLNDSKKTRVDAPIFFSLVRCWVFQTSAGRRIPSTKNIQKIDDFLDGSTLKYQRDLLYLDEILYFFRSRMCHQVIDQIGQPDRSIWTSSDVNI